MTNRHEAAIDAVIAETHAAYFAADMRVRGTEASIVEANARADQTERRATSRAHEAKRAARLWIELDALRETRDEARAAYETADAKYAGWARFFLVKNTNGHIHSSLNCSTCNWDTQFGWLTDMSGLTEADAVTAHGARLCSVCFPTAPVEWTQRYYADEKAARKLARETERAEKAAAKAAKAAAKTLTHHYFVRFLRASDGAVIDHDDPRSLKTLKGATKEAADWGDYNGRHIVIDANTGEAIA